MSFTRLLNNKLYGKISNSATEHAKQRGMLVPRQRNKNKENSKMEDHKLTLEEVVDMFSKTRERIKSLEKKALNRLFPGYTELKNEAEKLLKEQSSEPTDEQLAENLGWPLDRIISLKKEVGDFESRLNSAAKHADLEKLIDGMPTDLQSVLRDILEEIEKDIHYEEGYQQSIREGLFSIAIDGMDEAEVAAIIKFFPEEANLIFSNRKEKALNNQAIVKKMLDY